MKENIARDTIKALRFAIDKRVISDARLIQINRIIIDAVEEHCKEYSINLEEVKKGVENIWLI